MAEQINSGHPLGFHVWRRRWLQNLREAYWVLTGKWSLHRAWQRGYDQGSVSEWKRIIINKGDIEAQRRNVTEADANIARRAALQEAARS